MTRVVLLVTSFLFISMAVSGQCANPPTLNLSGTSGRTCGTSAFIISGNTFGGSATSVKIISNGTGSIKPASSDKTPFDITYTPSSRDIGTQVTITVRTNIPKDMACPAATATFTLTVSANPAAPSVGAITQPTCTSLTGSVVLNNLPSGGTWQITRSPGGTTTSGSGTSTTISGLPSGSFTFKVTNADGCTSNSSSAVTINSPPPLPASPVIGNITQPTCTVTTGSVALSGLPSNGTWTLTRSPGNVISTGSGSGITISNLPQGTYSYIVTNSSGCASNASANIVINAQPVIPSPPVVGTITVPTCALATGSVVLSGLPSSGTWTLTRYPGTLTSTGSGSSFTVSGLLSGTYNYTVATSSGCTSVLSSNIVIPAAPASPSAPLIGTVTQPGTGSPTGSVVLNGLPATGNWILTLSPGNMTTNGSGVTKTILGLATGLYSFTVTNAAGCTSAPSASVVINEFAGPPVVVINDPPPVCFPSTVNLTLPAVTAGSALNLVYTYWTDAAATKPLTKPGAATAGTYYIKGTNPSGDFTIKPVLVSVYTSPVASAGPDQIAGSSSTITLNAELANSYESGIWSLVSGTAEIFDSTSARTEVSGLAMGKNVFAWTVTNNACAATSDTIQINVSDLVIPTLITPNMDGKNDYLILKKSETISKMELIIFDRRGVEVYKNTNYDNSWNGVDYTGRALMDDTYFYVLRTDRGPSQSGYIVIRR